MMREALEQYKATTPPLWEGIPVLGITGYDVIELVADYDWEPISSWGKEGFDLGAWPLVIVFWRESEATFEVIEYVEGDATLYVCPTKEIRNQITDEIAFFHWKHTAQEWVTPYASVDELPSELRGPYGKARKTEGGD